MSRDKTAIFDKLDQGDAALVAEIAALSGMALPKACEAGVALNARLLQAHARIMRGEGAR